MIKYLLVGAGGFLGAVSRFGLGGLVQQWTGLSFPIGTFVINIVGCLAIGVLGGLAEARPWFTSNARMFLMVGILGGFTTFSSFGLETMRLMQEGRWGAAAANAAGQVALGLGAVWAGLTLAKFM